MLKVGRIYKLSSPQSDKMYIGSTTKTLKRRLVQHKGDYRSYLKEQTNYRSSFELIKCDDCYIELIKEVCCTKKQLLILEGEETNKYENAIKY